jgi:hypothetical protein
MFGALHYILKRPKLKNRSGSIWRASKCDAEGEWKR